MSARPAARARELIAAGRADAEQLGTARELVRFERPAARFCEECGARLGHACPNCSKEVGPQARFCPSCGATLAEAASPAERRPAAGEDTSIPGERRQLTVLFSDIVDSTP